MFSMRFLRPGLIRAKTILSNVQAPQRIQKVRAHDEGPPQPFDNLPFTVRSRYAATLAFSLFFGIGLWAPYFIVWYSMAKRSL